ncbi:MAG: HPr family phosphocarrier protein [Clostridia bacterium]|nr:HPr family phosphocarrier protein [Clostridia bacterium]
MKQFSYVLTKPHALHTRPVSRLMREVSRFSSSIYLKLGDQLVSLKQARALTKADRGSKIVVTVDGRDEEAAVAAIQNYFVANM